MFKIQRDLSPGSSKEEDDDKVKSWRHREKNAIVKMSNFLVIVDFFFCLFFGFISE